MCFGRNTTQLFHSHIIGFYVLWSQYYTTVPNGIWGQLGWVALRFFFLWLLRPLKSFLQWNIYSSQYVPVVEKKYYGGALDQKVGKIRNFIEKKIFFEKKCYVKPFFWKIEKSLKSLKSGSRMIFFKIRFFWTAL